MLVGFTCFASAASIHIQSTLKGKPLKPKKLSMRSDPNCVRFEKNAIDEAILVGKKGTLANVFVHIKEGLGQAQIKPANQVKTLDQKGCIYLPRVIGLQTHQTLEIINSDQTFHNVRSITDINPPFNLSMPNQNMKISKTFTKPELGIQLKCDLHTWMKSWINVVDHPYYAVTDLNGKASIENAPDGSYKIEAWHETLGTQTRSIHVKGQSINIDFVFLTH